MASKTVLVFLRGQNGLMKTEPYCHQRRPAFFGDVTFSLLTMMFGFLFHLKMFASPTVMAAPEPPPRWRLDT